MWHPGSSIIVIEEGTMNFSCQLQLPERIKRRGGHLMFALKCCSPDVTTTKALLLKRYLRVPRTPNNFDQKDLVTRYFKLLTVKQKENSKMCMTEMSHKFQRISSYIHRWLLIRISMVYERMERDSVSLKRKKSVNRE